ncbi:uncharacterized protein LOC110114874 [Dendrobium catenatum]|uniref:uncharacterized protein LOC110114874 n=1 Tax=Dendrobium catenatum TaxID=906689 RepID=UPI0010A00340|nr:uncharacterized protein LOC110114874 [Dendrobium catenatum]
MTSIDRREVNCLIGNDWEYFHYPAAGTSGGILVLWNKKMVSFVIKENSSQVIVGDLSVPNMGSCKVATVYGSRCCKERGSLWSQLEKCLDDSIPSIIGGDFTCMLNKEEKRGGKRHLARVASNHSPIVLKLDERVRFKSKAINFEDTYRSYLEAKNFVYHSWKKNDFGDEHIILQKKLRRTLKALFFLNKNKCKDLNMLKEKMKKEILELQNKEALGEDWSVDDLFLLRNKVHDFNVTLRRLSTWWNQWAKESWHEEGDTNSKLFHNFATARKNGNRINQVKDVFNKLQDGDDQIEKISVFQQGNNKSPGMDGVTSSFYKRYWSIVWETLWNAISCFLKSSHMNREWKDTLIVLISKVKNPLIPSNYRPIGHCQTNYKIVATMLVNRLKNCISKMISKEKMAFIPGRSISGHCFLAQEIFHKFKISKNKKELMAIKLDMEQAYDSMGWTTLRQILKWYGFPTDFSNLLVVCVVDVRFSNIINGKNSKWINAQSGFRQGCPLSPYLFILCSQIMSNSLEQRGQTLDIQPKGPNITHLLYVDDVFIFSHVSITLANTLKIMVEDFCKWTGQRVNFNKSQIIFGKVVSYLMKKRIARVLGFKVVKEMKYLGVKISLSRLKMANFQEHLSNIMDRLNAWGKKSFSMGGCYMSWKNFVENSFGIKLMGLMLLLSNGKWNYTVLQRAFHHDLILLISQIHIEYEVEDRVELLNMCSGKTVSALAYEQLLFNRFTLEDDGPYLSSWGTNLLRESQNTWCPQPKDWIKINVDASLLSSNLARIGGIFRDHKGRFISAFGKNKVHWDIAQLELEAAITASVA